MNRLQNILGQFRTADVDSTSLQLRVKEVGGSCPSEERPFFGRRVGPAHTGGRLAADGFAEQSVTHVFTLTGGHVSPIIVGCNQRRIRVIDVRDEATAVFAADAVARISGVPGVAIVTAGPGLTNVITPVKNAQMAESPLVVIGGATAMLLKGRGSLQDIDQIALLRPHVKQCFSVRRVKDIVPTIRKAFARATQGVPGPVFVEFPLDCLWPKEMFAPKKLEECATEKEKAAAAYARGHLDAVFKDAFEPLPPLKRPPSGDQFLCEFPQSVLNALLRRLFDESQCRRPVLVMGSQCTLQPTLLPAVVAAVELLNIPVFLSGMARGLLGRSHRLQRRHKRGSSLKACDFVLLCGVSCDFRLDYGRGINRKAHFAMVNLSGAKLKVNNDLRSKDVALCGDPSAFLIRLAQTAQKHKIQLDFPQWKLETKAREDAREAGIAETLLRNLAERREMGVVHPIECCLALDKVIGDNSFMIADGGDFVGTASYILKPRRPLRWLDPGAFGTLGCGAGFGIGCKALNPDAEVWLLFGDGSFGWSVMECDTWKRMGLPLIAVVGNDACWSQMWRAQVRVLKDPCATELHYARYDKVAQAFGCVGLLVTKAEDLQPTFREAQRRAKAGKPVVVNVLLSKSTFRQGSISI